MTRVIPILAGFLAGPAAGEEEAPLVEVTVTNPDEAADEAAAADENAEKEASASETAGKDVASDPAEDVGADLPTVEATGAGKHDASLVDPFAGFSLAPSATRVPVEQCDGTRSRETADPVVLSCEQWRVDWEYQGKVWGVSTASSRVDAEKARERVLGFARQYARYFGQAIEKRVETPTEAICDQCKHAVGGGRWGRGQRFSTAGLGDRIAAAETELAAYEKIVWGKHVAYLGDVARLAQEPRVKAAAQRYAKDMHAAVLQLPALRLELERAKVLRSADTVNAVTKHVDVQGKGLMRSFEGLTDAVAREVSAAHAGRYVQQGSSADGPQIVVTFDGSKVKATHTQAGVSAVWFEGTVALDGSLNGRSLVKPRDADLKCQDYSFECGYEYVPSVLRFARRDDDAHPEHLELWFQREAWERAPVFVR